MPLSLLDKGQAVAFFFKGKLLGYGEVVGGDHAKLSFWDNTVLELVPEEMRCRRLGKEEVAHLGENP